MRELLVGMLSVGFLEGVGVVGVEEGGWIDAFLVEVVDLFLHSWQLGNARQYDAPDADD